jgi:hypothetical protein
LDSVNGGDLKSVGTSAPTSFSVSGNSDDSLKIKITKLECLKTENGNNFYTVCLNSTYKSSNHNLSFNNSGSGISVTNLSFSPVYNISGLTPALVNQNSGSATTKSYCFTMSIPATETSVIIGMVGDDVNPNPNVTAQPFADTIVTLIPCACTFCDQVKIDVSGTPTISQLGNNVKFTQAISVTSLPSNAALNVKSLTAEIIYLDIKKDSAQCYSCDKNSVHYGKFVKADITNTSLQGELVSPGNSYKPSGEAIFSNKLVMQGTTDPGTPVTNAKMAFEIAVPDLNRCCKDTVNVCIKYTIITADCKSCSVTKCYELPRSK